MNGTRKRLALRFVPEQGGELAGQSAPLLGGHMDAHRFAAIRRRSGKSISEIARLLRVNDERHLRRIEAGEKPVSGPISILMEMIEDGRHG